MSQALLLPIILKIVFKCKETHSEYYNSTNYSTIYCNYHLGYRGDTTISDIARADLFSSAFPDIMPPEQLTFELKAKHMISDKYKEEDLDDLDPKEFKSEDSNEDEGDVYEVADQ